ncbi:MAG: aminopeptidase, partial [Janthinobacterium lividum]
YSTLGWFNDPVLSTFIKYPDGELARLVFHELAHQVVYVKNDSQFNESFAVAVEEAGVERWMASHGNAAMRQAYVAYEGRKRDFLDLLLGYRKRLALNYAGQGSDADKLRVKALIFQDLQQDYRQLKIHWGGYAGYDRWFAEPLSNAHLVSVATYHDLVPGFRNILKQAGSLPQFYESVRQLARLDETSRHRQLALAAGDEALAAHGGKRNEAH